MTAKTSVVREVEGLELAALAWVAREMEVLVVVVKASVTKEGAAWVVTPVSAVVAYVAVARA